MTLNQQIASYIANAQFADIDPRAIQKAKELIVYHVSLALRGRRDQDAHGEQAIRAARRMSPFGGPSSIIGVDARAMPIDAAFANCTQMRAYGLDDVIFPAGIHAGLMTIPAALALAEECRCSGSDVLSAIILGYEVMGKLGTFTWATSSPRRPTMVYGTFGSTLAAARVLGLNAEQLAHAVGYAAHSAQGLAESNLGPVTHYYALAVRAGITGAILAQEGGISSPTVLEGAFGFFETFLDGRPGNVDGFLASLGRDYAIMTSVEKRYPGTGLNIVAIESLRELVQEHGLRPAAVREVRVLIPEERANFAAGHSTGPFTCALSSPSSCVYQMAMILLDGTLDFRRYAQIDNPELLAIASRIKPVLVAGRSNIRWTRIEVDLADGRSFAREGESFTFAPIDPHQRLSSAAEGLLTQHQVDEFFERVMRLDRETSVIPTMMCLVPRQS
jgi:2-methylcitrate dehydratase PrpD